MALAKQHSEGIPTEENHEGIHNHKKCLICDKAFTFRKKVVCSRCENAFCVDHCCKEIATVEGCKVICDACYHDFRKEKLHEQISEEIELLNQELNRAREASRRVERDVFDKTSEISALENHFSEYETDTLNKCRSHEKEIKEYEERQNDLNTKNNSISHELEEVLNELSTLNTRYTDTDCKLEETKNNNQVIKNVKSELSEQLMHMREKIKYCLDYEKASELLCEQCKLTLKRAYQERVNKDADELNESSVSIYQTPSILDSVRELKESLNLLVVEPEKHAKCIII